MKGFAVFFITIVVLMAMFGIVMNIALVAFLEAQILNNATKSTQAYYAAEGGMEDVLLRIGSMSVTPFSYNLDVGSGTTTVGASGIIGGVRTITAEGDVLGMIRKVQVVRSINSQQISFYYGAQVGEGGMVMGNNSRVKGNVFSNGTVYAPAGRGFIDNSIVVASSGNKIKELNIGGDAMAHTCENCDIVGELTYVSGGSYSSCTYSGSEKERPNEIDPIPLPISSSQIDDWKDHAATGGVFAGNYVLDGASDELGPIQIGTEAAPASLTVDNNAHLTLTGTIYVTGDVLFNNNSIIDLDPASYASLSGVIIADGKVTIDNGAVLQGSGESGSYILVASTNNSLDPVDPAVFVGNNAQGAIIYTTQGIIFLKNNMVAREVTGYKIQINNNAEVEYESGLENANFASGPGGSWQIKSWSEVE